MAITTKPIEASQDFIDRLNPKKKLRAWLKQALLEDDLALFFMYTDPPSEAECQYGVQLIDKAALPLEPNAYYSYNGGRFSPNYWGTNFMGFTDAATLLSTEWLEDFEKVNLLNGSNIDHDGSSTLTLVPRSDVKLHKTAIRTDSLFTRCGVYATSANVVRPYKWAVLARKSAFNPRLRSWFGDAEHPHSRGTSYPADYLLFDFRGGVPLTVGTFGSEANVWLREQRDINHNQYKASYTYPSSVEIGRVHIPSIGD